MYKRKYLFIFASWLLIFLYIWYLFYEIGNNFKFFCYTEWIVELNKNNYKNIFEKWKIYKIKSYKWEFKINKWKNLYELHINNWDIKRNNYKNISYYSSGSIINNDILWDLLIYNKMTWKLEKVFIVDNNLNTYNCRWNIFMQ